MFLKDVSNLVILEDVRNMIKLARKHSEMSLSICINVKYTLMANSRCASKGDVPLPNLIRSAVSVVRLTVCDSLSGWKKRRLDLDDSNKGDVARLWPFRCPFSLGMFHSMDGRLSYLKHYRITET